MRARFVLCALIIGASFLGFANAGANSETAPSLIAPRELCEGDPDDLGHRGVGNKAPDLVDGRATVGERALLELIEIVVRVTAFLP